MKVRAWYGLTGEIEVENELCHLVRVGNVALNHPPVVNLILRRRLPHGDRLRLSYLHEFGHFQTLPFALLHLLLLLGSTLRRRRSLSGWLARIIGLFVANEGIWEMAAEAYVIMHEGKGYLATYRKMPNPFVIFFWVGMSGLGIGLSWRILRPNVHSFPNQFTQKE